MLKSIAPGVDAAPRTDGLTGEPSQAELGYLHCGPAGAGHFVKMIHNGIEYGMMAAYAEGLNILHHANRGKEVQSGKHSAEVTLGDYPEHYQYDIDVAAVTELWRRGSGQQRPGYSTSLAHALSVDPGDGVASAGRVRDDSGEGRWTVDAAIDTGVPAPVLAALRFARSPTARGEALYGDKILPPPCARVRRPLRTPTGE